MREVIVNPCLDQDLLVYRSMSFYDLMDLITFGQLTFDHSARLRSRQRRGLKLRVAKDKARLSRQGNKNAVTEIDLTVPQRDCLPARRGAACVRYQRWTMFDEGPPIDWSPLFEPSVHIVSSIRALANSLLASDNLRIFIDRTSGIYSPSHPSVMPRASAAILEDHSLAVIVRAARGSVNPDCGRSSLRIPVDLEALLAGVIVSPHASTRFLEMVTALVQRTARAFVSRANGRAQLAGIDKSTVRQLNRT